MANFKIYDMRSGTGIPVTGDLQPYPVLRRDSLASDDQKRKIIPMRVQADSNYVILPDTDTVNGGVGCVLILYHNEPKGHWYINTNSSLDSDVNWQKATPSTPVQVTLSGGADSDTGADFWLKCDCDDMESIGTHNLAGLQAYGVVSLVSGSP